MSYLDLQREAYLRKISQLENDLDKEIRAAQSSSSSSTSTNECSVSDAVVNIHKCANLIHKGMASNLKSFDECVIKANSINDVTECVKKNAAAINKLNTSGACKIDENCKFSGDSSESWKVGCFVNTKNMADLQKCIHELSSEIKEPSKSSKKTKKENQI